MPTKYDLFDRSRLTVMPLGERKHDFVQSEILPLSEPLNINTDIEKIAKKILESRRLELKGSVILMMGAHVIRAGVQRYLIDLIEKGLIDCIAMNGAGVIHDFELALIGATTESVAKYIQGGKFGLWKETGILNEIVADASIKGYGLGESVGKHIVENDLPFSKISVLASAYSRNVPVTVHVGIGYDIVHEHPNCRGAAYGDTSYTDFLIFSKILESLSGGVVMNFGSAVMAPEVFLKALAMVRNAAAQSNEQIVDFTTAVFDVRPLAGDICSEPPKTNPDYFFRPWKTMLVRTVQDGGESRYIRGRHEETIPQLWSALIKEVNED